MLALREAECCALARTNYRSTTGAPAGESPAAYARSVRRTAPPFGARALPRLLAPVAFIGLLLSAAWHVGLLFHHDLLGPGGTVLFIGIFVVWFPTVFYLRRFDSTTGQGRRSWKVWLAGGPDWLYPLLQGIVVYAVINFGLGFLGVYSMEGPGFWRMASGHAMVFYGAAWGVAYAAMRREDEGIEWRCQNGHEVPPDAKFCAECGAPVIPPRFVPGAGA